VFWTPARDGRGFSFLAGFLHGWFLHHFQEMPRKKTAPRQDANLAFLWRAFLWRSNKFLKTRDSRRKRTGGI
jgi:hypothetical protein